MKKHLTLLVILFSMIISACQSGTAVNDPTVAEISTDEESRTLTICLAYEPDSLYPYAATTQAARDVLQAIYDGPIDEINEQAVPVILSFLPSYQDDSARLTTVSVQAGDSVVDIFGDVIELQTGAQVYPGGCRDNSCAITWDGTSNLQMDQSSANFELLDGINWSDGTPLTTADSIYSFDIAADTDTPGDKHNVERTASYTAIDETNILWTGLPGLVTDEFEDYFWMPLPQHEWGQYSASELLASEMIARDPLGWGPYIMDEWIEGEYIRLKKNPNYFRANEGLPKFEYLIFKITDPYGDTNMANLKFDREPYAQFDFDVGEFEEEVSQNGCDLTSSTADMNDQLSVINILMNYFSDSVIQVNDGLGKQVQWLLFNQKSSSDGQTALFNSGDMRQAAAACLERGELADTVFFNLVNIPQTISLNYQESETEPNALLLPDPENGMEILNENGWIDGNPRTAQNIDGYEDGAPLSINYLVSDDSLSLSIANQVKQSLSECGMQVNIIAVSPEVFWNRNEPESIFQGNYHLAQLEWPLPVEDPCALFNSQNIPSEENDFNGLNFGGFSNERVNAICEELQTTHLTYDRQILLDEIEEILNEELTLVPLYTAADLMVSRSDFCAVDSGNSSISELSQIELFDYGEGCQP